MTDGEAALAALRILFDFENGVEYDPDAAKELSYAASGIQRVNGTLVRGAVVPWEPEVQWVVKAALDAVETFDRTVRGHPKGTKGAWANLKEWGGTTPWEK